MPPAGSPAAALVVTARQSPPVRSTATGLPSPLPSPRSRSPRSRSPCSCSARSRLPAAALLAPAPLAIGREAVSAEESAGSSSFPVPAVRSARARRRAAVGRAALRAALRRPPRGLSARREAARPPPGPPPCGGRSPSAAAARPPPGPPGVSAAARSPARPPRTRGRPRRRTAQRRRSAARTARRCRPTPCRGAATRRGAAGGRARCPRHGGQLAGKFAGNFSSGSRGEKRGVVPAREAEPGRGRPQGVRGVPARPRRGERCGRSNRCAACGRGCAPRPAGSSRRRVGSLCSCSAGAVRLRPAVVPRCRCRLSGRSAVLREPFPALGPSRRVLRLRVEACASDSFFPD